MAYASIGDIKERCRRELSDREEILAETLAEDASVIVDAYNADADMRAKQLVICSMVIRALGDEESAGVPIGANQGTVSALGYSQTWSMASGATTGELYLTKMEKTLLGISGGKIGARSPLEDIC